MDIEDQLIDLKKGGGWGGGFVIKTCFVIKHHFPLMVKCSHQCALFMHCSFRNSNNNNNKVIIHLRTSPNDVTLRRKNQLNKNWTHFPCDLRAALETHPIVSSISMATVPFAMSAPSYIHDVPLQTSISVTRPASRCPSLASSALLPPAPSVCESVSCLASQHLGHQLRSPPGKQLQHTCCWVGMNSVSLAP